MWKEKYRTMARSKIQVEDLEIRIEPINDNDYVSLTDIAKKSNEEQPSQILQRWMRNNGTLQFLHTWESVHNPDFKVVKMNEFKVDSFNNTSILSIQRFIKETNAIGIISKSGRYGGTYAHKEIALHFCGWLSPSFQVFLFKAFSELMEKEYQRKNLEWHISKLTDNVEEMRNLLDTIPGQIDRRNRLK